MASVGAARAISARRRRIGSLSPTSSVSCSDAAPQLVVLGLEPVARQGVAQGDEHALALERLLEEVERAAPRASTAVAMSPWPEIMRTGGAPSRSTMPVEHLEAVHPGHLDVEQHGRGRAASSSASAGGRLRPVATS